MDGRRCSCLAMGVLQEWVAGGVSDWGGRWPVVDRVIVSKWGGFVNGR